MAKICELCESQATTFCDSDQASLCWRCDHKVHSTNFLVARHSRNLLCQICQSLTAWSGSGSKLFPAISRCQKCSDGDVERENFDSVSDELQEMKDDDVDGECQVVPWSSSIPPPCSPAVSCSSSDDDMADDEADDVDDDEESCSDVFVPGKFQPLDSALTMGEDSGRRFKRKA